MITTITSIVVALTALGTAIAALIKAGGTVWEELTKRVVANEKQIKETNKKVEEQQALINKLVETSMSASAFRHLAGITVLHVYNYWQNEEVGELFQREFYYLKNRGFIGPETLEFDERLNRTNIAERARPTEIGKIYIALRKDDIPKDWLSADPEKRRNLKIDVARDLGLKVPDEETLSSS